MTNKNISIAKGIFMKYGGSHFHMEREGEFEYYKSFGISKEQEMLWFEEYQQELLNKIKTENIVSFSFSQLCEIIIRNKNMNLFRLLLNYIKEKRNQIDSFSQMRMAEEVGV